MFFPFAAAAVVAIGLIKLGTVSVMVGVLTSMLSLVLAAVLIVGRVYAWRRHRRR